MSGGRRSAPPAEPEGTHGYLALVQLLASAAVDRKLAPASRTALALLARHAGPDGTCCVSLPGLAKILGVSRQAVQKALRQAERKGYITSERRHRKSGAEGAKVFTFNLELAGALACPWKPVEEASAAGGEQPPEVAGGSNRQRLRGEQPPEVAHKKPSEETIFEETSACSASPPVGPRRRGGTSEEGASRGSNRQRPLLLPITGTGGKIPGVTPIRQRIDAHNLALRREASGRMWHQWSRLDPAFALFDQIGAGRDAVVAKAEDLELEGRGRGCRYIAGAVERATGGAITGQAILSGCYGRREAMP